MTNFPPSTTQSKPCVCEKFCLSPVYVCGIMLSEKNPFLIFKDISWDRSQPENWESYKKGKLIEMLFETFIKRILKTKNKRWLRTRTGLGLIDVAQPPTSYKYFFNFLLLWFLPLILSSVQYLDPPPLSTSWSKWEWYSPGVRRHRQIQAAIVRPV